MNNVIFSFDFEIGWGDVTNGIWKRRQANGVYNRLRIVLPQILETLDDHDIPVTWATVGAMIDPSNSRDFTHLTEKQLCIVDKAIKESEANTFNGIDLFETVLSSKVEHQVACHSYSHIPFNFEGVDEIFVREDLRRFNNALSRYNLSTNRFVFPENTESFYRELSEAGIKKVRVAADNLFSNRYLYLLTITFVPPPASKETIDRTGISRHYGSMLYNDVGNPYRIPLLERRLQLGLRNVIDKGHTLHIWAHPFNFAESAPLLKSFTKTIKNIATLRDSGKLSIALM